MGINRLQLVGLFCVLLRRFRLIWLKGLLNVVHPFHPKMVEKVFYYRTLICNLQVPNEMKMYCIEENMGSNEGLNNWTRQEDVYLIPDPFISNWTSLTSCQWSAAVTRLFDISLAWNGCLQGLELDVTVTNKQTNKQQTITGGKKEFKSQRWKWSPIQIFISLPWLPIDELSNVLLVCVRSRVLLRLLFTNFTVNLDEGLEIKQIHNYCYTFKLLAWLLPELYSSVRKQDKNMTRIGFSRIFAFFLHHIENVRKRKRLIIVYSYTDLTLALMISFPGGSGYNLRTLSQSCFNQGSTTASGLKRQTLNDFKKMLYTLTKSTTAFVKWTFWRSKS